MAQPSQAALRIESRRVIARAEKGLAQRESARTRARGGSGGAAGARRLSSSSSATRSSAAAAARPAFETRFGAGASGSPWRTRTGLRPVEVSSSAPSSPSPSQQAAASATLSPSPARSARRAERAAAAAAPWRREAPQHEAEPAWVQVAEPSSGDLYWWNTRTMATQWERPAGMGAAAPPPAHSSSSELGAAAQPQPQRAFARVVDYGYADAEESAGADTADEPAGSSPSGTAAVVELGGRGSDAVPPGLRFEARSPHRRGTVRGASEQSAFDLPGAELEASAGATAESERRAVAAAVLALALEEEAASTRWLSREAIEASPGGPAAELVALGAVVPEPQLVRTSLVTQRMADRVLSYTSRFRQNEQRRLRSDPEPQRVLMCGVARGNALASSDSLDVLASHLFSSCVDDVACELAIISDAMCNSVLATEFK